MSNVGISLLAFAYLQGYAKVDPQKSASKFKSLMRNFLIVSKVTEQSKVVIKFTDSILDTVNILLNLQVGDTSRLEHVKRMILEDKPLYSSDRQYVSNLANIYIDYQTKTEDVADNAKTELAKCNNCGTGIPRLAKYCNLCGARQKREYSDIIKIAKRYNPLQVISRPNSYQTLAIIGGLTAMIPVLFIVARMDPLLEAINYETEMDLSEMAGFFVFLGIISSVLSAMSIGVTFLVKNPRKVGRILFFMSFGILTSSIMIGVVGFFFILLASNIAYKKRHY